MSIDKYFRAMETGNVEDGTFTKTYCLIDNDDEQILLTPEKYAKLIQDCQNKVDWYENKKLEFVRASSLYDSMTKHFGQDGENLIQEALSKRKKITSFNSSQQLTYVFKIINDSHSELGFPF